MSTMKFENSESSISNINRLEYSMQPQFSSDGKDDETFYKKIFSLPKDNEAGNSVISSNNRLTFGGQDIYGKSTLTASPNDSSGGTRHFSGHSTFSFGRSVIEPNPTDRTNPAVPGGDSPLTPTTGGKYISEAADFDKLNISKSGKPENEVLTGSEITRGAVSHMLKADANDNSQLDRQEWTSIASQFGLNQDEAARAYSKANQDGQDGLSLSEMNRLAEQSITPEIMTADKSKDGKLSRAEFQSLVQDGPQKPGDKPPSIPEQTTDRILENLQRELEQLQQKLTELLEWLKNLLEQQPGPKPNPDVPNPKPFPDVPTPTPDVPTPTPDVPAPTPDVPDIPGIPDLPIPQDINPLFVDPPEGRGEGEPFPDRGKTTPDAKTVVVENISQDVQRLEQNGQVNPKSVDGDNVYATKPVPELWIKMNGRDGKPVYMSMQVNHIPFQKTPYSKDANGGLQVKESVSFDPYAEHAIDPNMNHERPQLFYRSTDGNLRPLETTSLKADVGQSPGHPKGAWYDLSFKVKDDMAFVRQEFTDGNGSEGNDYRAPKNLEKVLIDGNMMSYAEAYKEGILYGQAPSAPIKPSFPDNIWDTAPTWDGERY